MRKVLLPLLSACLAFTSVAASAAPRTPAPVSDSEELGGSPWLVIILLAVAVGGFIALISDSEDAPLSP